MWILKMEDSAVIIRNGYKTFHDGFKLKDENGVKVLQNFSMTVPSGCLYSLLGSSGCGKTTVLSCLIGLTKLDTGALCVFGSSHVPVCSRRWQKIGYMPQEISLYDSFSISETLIFFGTIFSLNGANRKHEYLLDRIKFLGDLLKLPAGHRRVGTLSGGQRRRLSFAVAVIHEPDLLLLDEPTSGVDPLVREHIWRYLTNLCREYRTTIILTTHYVEEAKSSDIVGIMRDGRLIAEESPTKLSEKYHSDSLESVFLHLCKQQEANHQIFSDELEISTNIKLSHGSAKLHSKKLPYFSNQTQSSALRIWAMVIKNYKCMFRNLWMLVFITLIPAVCMLVTCITFQNEPHNISFGVVNHDLQNNTSCYEKAIEVGCPTDELSCQFIDDLPIDTIRLIEYSSVNDSTDAVKQGKIWGYVHFPQNYSSSLKQRFVMGAEAFSEDVDEGNKIWDESLLKVSLDQTNTLIYGAILATLHETLEKSQMRLLQVCGKDARLGEFPLKYKKPLVGTEGMTSLNFIAPGLAIGILYFFPLTVSLRFITEKRQGTLDRCIVGGTQIWEILVAYAIPESIILVFQSFLVYLILHYGFQIGSSDDFRSSVIILTLFILQGLSGLSSGFLLGVLFQEEAQAAVTIIAIIFPSSFLSGILWPVEGMPKILQFISPLLPMSLPGAALRSLMARGDFGMYSDSVWQGFLMVIAYVLVPFICTLALIKKQMKR